MKTYLVKFIDTFSFAVTERTANLTDAQYKKAMQQKKDKVIVVDRFDSVNHIHITLRLKSIKVLK